MKDLKDFSLLTAKLSHILGMNCVVSTATTRNTGWNVLSTTTDHNSQQHKSNGNGDGKENNLGKQSLWVTHPYKDTVPIKGSTGISCDNELVRTKVTRPKSPWKKKHNSVVRRTTSTVNRQLVVVKMV